MQVWVDVVLVVFGVLSVWRAWRSGAIVALAAALGWAAGLWLGVLLAPQLATFMTTAGWADPALRAIISLILVLLCAAVFNALLIMLAGVITRAVKLVPFATTLNRLVGAVIGVLTWAAVIWLLSGIVQTMRLQPLADFAKSSTVVTTIDRIAPIGVSGVVGQLGAAFQASGLPQVFGSALESIPQVAAPSLQVPAALARSSLSVLEVVADQHACGTTSTGTGWVEAGGTVITNAHVVAGATSVTVGFDGVKRPATVEWYDPDIDIAVLKVAALPLPAIADGAALAVGDQAYAAGFPEGGPYQVSPARVRAVITADGKDIYGGRGVSREVYSLRTILQPGNSGGPLLDSRGDVVGMVFARSLSDAQTGYALTLKEIAPTLAKAATLSGKAVSTGQCIATTG